MVGQNIMGEHFGNKLSHLRADGEREGDRNIDR
jgi:hypothetical protein